MTSWYLRKTRRTDARLRLFCLPYAGGSAAIYRDWSDVLGPRIEVMAIELPGHGSRRSEEPFTATEPLVEALLSALLPDFDRPFAILGYSMGALLGYELARRLYARVGLQPRRLFACAHGAPDYPRSRSPAYELPDPQFIAELRRLNGTPHELLADAELMQLMLPLLRADFRLNETYQHRSLPQLSCPVSAYGGSADEDVSEAALMAWRSATRGAFSHRLFAGDHFFIHSATAPLLRQIEVDLGLA